MEEPLTSMRLKALGVPEHPRPYDLGERAISVGRASDNEIVLDGENYPSVSSHHARFEYDAEGVWVEDLGARNGTLVNDVPVTRARLEPGDVVRLGHVGPRFVLLGAQDLQETAYIDPDRVARPRLSRETVEDMVEQRARKNLRKALAVIGTLAAGGLAVMIGMALHEGRLAKERERVTHDELVDTRRVLDEFEAQAAERATERSEDRLSRDAAEVALRAELAAVQRSRNELQGRIGILEAARGTVAGRDELDTLRQELESTRTRLDEARRRVDLFDPVNLEQARLGEVARVREAVVLIEAKMSLIDRRTGSVLHEAFTQTGPRPNFDDEGVPWSLESTGSGFCISSDGHVMTNAHVVFPPDDDPLLERLDGLPIEPRMELAVVFSGEDSRHPATVLARAPNADLAIVQIEPFEGMPHLTGFDAEAAPPAPGSDVFLFGFPLGNFALQEGERVIASTFRGILSREVDGILQVDAGVHPGNSGGPITDDRGRVIGIVFSVQATPEQTAVYTIGYGLPVSEAQAIWPLPPVNNAEQGE